MEIFPIPKDSWDIFTSKSCRELSDFESWAMMEIYERIYGKGTPYAWVDGHIELNMTQFVIELHLTHTEIVFIKLFEIINCERVQIRQSRIKL